MLARVGNFLIFLRPLHEDYSKVSWTVKESLLLSDLLQVFQLFSWFTIEIQQKENDLKLNGLTGRHIFRGFLKKLYSKTSFTTLLLPKERKTVSGKM